MDVISFYITHLYIFFFFFNDTATTEIYTLSLHDALPISQPGHGDGSDGSAMSDPVTAWSFRYRPHSTAAAIASAPVRRDRKSTRLNSSHANISYAVFCLKKKKTNITHQ